MPAEKLRFRFAKTGLMRLLSHHDLLRCFERMLRRADLPVRTTAGCRPGPRIVFPLPLALGIIGLEEVVEVEFLQPQEPHAALAALAAQAPQGLRLTRVGPVPMQAVARARRVEYLVPLSPDRLPHLLPLLHQTLQQQTLWVPRLRPTPKYLNIRPYLRRLEIVTTPTVHWPAELLLEPLAIGLTQPPFPALRIDLWVTQDGTARAEELLRSLALADLLEQGTVLIRTVVELRDEVSGASTGDQPPDGPADSRPLEPETLAALLEAEQKRHVRTVPEQRLEGSVVE